MDEREIVRMIGEQAPSQPPQQGWRCPSAELVAAYLEQRLGVKDKLHLEAHLAHCDFCIGLVSSLVRHEKAEEPFEAPAQLIRQGIDAVGETVSTGSPWRWVLLPALASVIVASAVLLKSPQRAQDTPPSAAVPIVEKAVAPTPAIKSQSPPPVVPEVRSLKTPTTSLRILQPHSGSIVRGELRFRWEAVVTAVNYEIRVVNATGDPVWRAESTDPAAQVPAGFSLQSGKYFVWVLAHLSDGRTVKSETIAFRIGSSG